MKSLRLAILGLIGLGSCGSPVDEGTSNLVESSTSFDRENVRPFLSRVSKLVYSGFGPSEVDRTMKMIEGLKPDGEETVSFGIVHGGTDGRLVISAFAGDVDVVDLAFFSPEALAAEIDADMDMFFEELGN